MNDSLAELKEAHWQHDILGSIEVGILVLDRQYRVQLWNEFMVNNSGILPSDIRGQELFTFFDEIDRDWFITKAKPVFDMRTPAFVIWEQRPYLFKFAPNRPVTSAEKTMYQNITLFPLASVSGQVEQVCVVVYDVTDEAVSKKTSSAAKQRLTEMTRVDGLTGLYNRRYWEERCQQEFKRCARNQHQGALIMLDIDHFKKVNDTYGHPTGDQVIKEMAAIIAKAIRETDVAGRYGGEEFAIILPETDGFSAKLVAERIRRIVQRKVVEHEEHSLQFTCSLGVAEFNSTDAEHGKWLERADQALYQAKRGGRNQVVVV